MVMNYTQDVMHARYMVKWNPRVALELFRESYAKAFSETRIKDYNEAAREANEFLNNLENHAYYSAQDFWEDVKPYRIPLITEEVTGFDQKLKELLYARH